MRFARIERTQLSKLAIVAGVAIVTVSISQPLRAQQEHHHHHGSPSTYYGGGNVGQNYGGTVISGGPYVAGHWIAGPYGVTSGVSYPPLVIPAGSYFASGLLPQQNINPGPMVGFGFGAGGFGNGGVGNNIGFVNNAGFANNGFAQPNAFMNNAGFAGGGAAGVGNAGAPVKARPSNGTAQARAREQMGIGDEKFNKHRYNEAYQRYKDAALNAPDVAEIQFRQGIAASVMGQHATAARAIKRGLSLDPNWPSSKFTLDTLWQGNQAAKIAAREALAEAALQHPDDEDIMFLLGVQLYFGGERNRSKTFFEKAATLNPADSVAPRMFIGEMIKQAAPAAPAGPRAI